MVGKISVVPSNKADVHGEYSYYRIEFGEVVWFITISPAVKSIVSVKRIRGACTLSVVIRYEVNNESFEDEEVLDLWDDADTLLGSKDICSLLKRVERWELGG